MAFLCNLNHRSLRPAGGSAPAALPGAGGHAGSPRRRPRAGVCAELPAALLQGRRQVDDLAGPLQPGGKAALGSLEQDRALSPCLVTRPGFVQRLVLIG